MMKKNIKIKSTVASLAVATALLFAVSCTKDADNPENGEPGRYLQQVEKPIENKEIQERLLELRGLLPTVVVYNETMDKYIALDLNNPKSFSFTAPSGGASFSSPSGSVQFVPAGNGNFTIVTTPASAGGGGGGGVVTAGDITLNVNYVLCFASGDPNDDLNFFDLGPSGTGFSGAIGIAGNFEDLASGEFDDDTDPFDFFQGVVAYYAFSGQPSGSFPVIDFFEFEEDFDGNFDNKGLAYLLSFQENSLGIFFSKSGQLSFGGSSVDFNGTYYGITGSFFDFDDDGDDDDFDDFNFVEVSGTGVLECGA